MSTDWALSIMKDAQPTKQRQGAMIFTVANTGVSPEEEISANTWCQALYRFRSME